VTLTITLLCQPRLKYTKKKTLIWWFEQNGAKLLRILPEFKVFNYFKAYRKRIDVLKIIKNRRFNDIYQFIKIFVQKMPNVPKIFSFEFTRQNLPLKRITYAIR